MSPRSSASNSALSRRQALRELAGAAAILVAGSVGACSAPEARAEEPLGGDDALLADILARSAPHISRRTAPYRVTQTLVIPAGRTVTVEAGTRIVWAGPATRPGRDLVGVFEAGGDDTGVVVQGGEAFVECERPSPTVYAAAVFGQRGFSVVNLRAVECQHVCTGAGTTDYAGVRTSGPDANVARDVRILGGGARYAALQGTGQGACLLGYVAGCRVEDVTYENVNHGIQWWGGDAGLERWQNGQGSNQRKCLNLVIERATVRHTTGAGIWGSMGHHVLVRDCSAEDCRDLCFDAEGCVDTTFERCVARDGYNGCFATFALCDGVHFVGCQGTVSRYAFPLFRVYNVTQSPQDNRIVEVVGGRFECTDPAGPATMDTAMGPVRDLTIRDAALRNVRIDTANFNMHRTRIIGNTLDFPYGIGDAAAIRAGASRQVAVEGRPTLGGVEIRGNRIRYAPDRPRGKPVAVEVVENDFNSVALGTIAGNTVSGPFATGLVVANASGNIGVAPVFEISGNRFNGLAAGARVLRAERQGPATKPPVLRWDSGQLRDGRTVVPHAALG